MLLPAVAWAGPPALPEGEPQPAPTTAGPDPEGGTTAQPPANPDAAGPSPGTGTNDLPFDGDDAAAAPQASDPETESMSLSAAASVDESGVEASTDSSAEGDENDPGMVRGRREGLMPMNGGAIGLFHTTLPDVGGKYTVRVRLYTDFFRREGFIYEGPNGPDTHSRVRGGVALGFTPFKYGELFFSVNNSASRNERDQPEGQEESPTIFALGDMNFGFKAANRFKNGVGLGGQLGLGLLSGEDRLFTSNVNFWFDVLFAVDVRYMTKKQFPFRFTANLGWILDNTLRVNDYTRFQDPVAAEVARFSLNANHNRLRMRYAVDFPIRLGKEKQFGLDPMLEWSWDVSTTEEPFFARDDAAASPLPRSSSWLTLGLRANVVSGLHVGVAADIGLVSPNFEYGPPTPPWQVLLGLGWSFDPKPIVKEVEVESKEPPPPQPVMEGRVVGQVVDPDGNPVPDARISFPGLTSGVILTDSTGSFTSFRFPAGTVTIQVSMNDQMVKEAVAEIADGEDRQVTIQLDTPPEPASGELAGTFTDTEGNAVAVKMYVVGQGVDETFDSDERGLIRLLLYEGEYRATLSAPGFVDKTVTFTVTADGPNTVSEQLTRDAPPETPLVSAAGKSIRLRKKIRYTGGNDVAQSSHEVLDQLATFLKYHPEYAVVQVGVHTDDKGAAQKRSEDRANAVVNYLTGKGISSSRLKARGYGASRPVAVNMTASGRAKNNRTTFSIIQRN